MTKTRIIIFSLIPVVVLLTILEIVGRVIYPFDPAGRAELLAERDPRLIAPFENTDAQVILEDIFGMKKRYVSFLGFTGAPGIKLSTIENNSLGFRDSEVSNRKSDEFRILVLGGSAAWGWGASSNGHTITGAAENLLNEANSEIHYRVMNGAFQAWTSLHERIVLMEFFDRFDPDLVISFSGFNDIISVLHNNSRELLRLEHSMLEKAVDNNLSPIDTFTAIKKVAGTLGVWRIVVYFKELIQQRRGSGNSRVDYSLEMAEYGIPKILDRYSAMADYASRRGAIYMLVLQPDIYTSGKVLTSEEEKVKQWLDRRNSENFQDTLAEYRSDLKIGMSKLIAQGITVVDLQSVFDSIKESVFVDDSHFNDKGYLQIAKAIILEIVKKQEGASGNVSSGNSAEPYSFGKR